MSQHERVKRSLAYVPVYLPVSTFGSWGACCSYRLSLHPYSYLSAETVRSIVQSTAERVVLQEVSLGLLEQPWFWSVALATGAEELELVLVEGEGLGWVEESLKRISSVAQEVLPEVSVGLV